MFYVARSLSGRNRDQCAAIIKRIECAVLQAARINVEIVSPENANGSRLRLVAANSGCVRQHEFKVVLAKKLLHRNLGNLHAGNLQSL